VKSVNRNGGGGNRTRVQYSLRYIIYKFILFINFQIWLKNKQHSSVLSTNLSLLPADYSRSGRI